MPPLCSTLMAYSAHSGTNLAKLTIGSFLEEGLQSAFEKAAM